MSQTLNRRFMLFCLLLFIALQAGCSIPTVNSRWKAEEIAVNGTDEEWQGTPQYHEEKKRVTIRVTNDRDALYVCFSTNDRELKRTVMMSGITLWIDPENDKNKNYGARIPASHPSRPPDRPKERPGRSEEKQKPFRKEGMDSFKDMKKLVLIHPDLDGAFAMSIADAAFSGATVGAGNSGGRLVVEFRISLTEKASLFALDLPPFIGIGIESGNGGMDKMDQNGPSGGSMDFPDGGMGGPPSGGGGPGGGMGGPPSGGGGRGGMMGGGPGGGRHFGHGQMGEEFEVWLNVQLARKQLTINDQN